MMNKKRTKEIGRTKYLMFLPLAALLMIVSNIETVARTSEIWMPTLTAIEELPLSIINPEQKGETTFHVTIVDKQGKVVPNVKNPNHAGGKTTELQDRRRWKDRHHLRHERTETCHDVCHLPNREQLHFCSLSRRNHTHHQHG